MCGCGQLVIMPYFRDIKIGTAARYQLQEAMELPNRNPALKRILLFVLRSKRRREINRSLRRITRTCRSSRVVALFLVLSLIIFCLRRGTKNVHEGATPTSPLPPGSSAPNHTAQGPCSPFSPDFYTCHLPKSMYTKGESFHQALDARVADDGSVYVTLVDLAVVDLATNLYESSFRRHGIENIVFVCTDTGSIEAMAQVQIDCYNFAQDWNDPKYYDTLLGVFKRKTHLKTKVALSVLLLGYTVIMTDVDMVFLRNPYLFLRKHLKTHDMQLLFDDSDQTTAFYIAKPTYGSIEAHKRTLSTGIPNQNTVTDRRMMLAAIFHLERAMMLSTRNLDIRYFQDGKTYFETGMRMFYSDNPCETCVAVHNNWVYSHQGKIYRMKENLMWYIDEGGYYTSTTTRYMTYSNPMMFDDDPVQTVQLELQTLGEALTIAFLLKRVLILPTFHCGHCQNEACHNIQRQCALNAYINMHVFHSQFKDHYREHVFLANPRVPDSVHQLTSRPILIHSKKVDLDVDVSLVRHVFTPENAYKGAEPYEILAWFGADPYERYLVLQFHSLYGVFAGIRHKEAYRENIAYQIFTRKLLIGLREVNYRQLEVDHKHKNVI